MSATAIGPAIRAAAGSLVALLLLTAPAHATAPYLRKLPPLLTPWTRSVSTVAPLAQYPRPQLERSRWLSLNGRWQYDAATPGQRPPFGRSLTDTILVPFPVQSPLSGIERSDTRGFYRRTFTVPARWRSQHVLLDFGAVSWSARVYVNGRLAGTHRGDYTAFSLDVTRLLHRRGRNELIVGYENPVGAADEPVGKQIPGAAGGISHTANSGIWQTVWLEPVAASHITALELVPDVRRDRLMISASVAGAPGARIVAQALAGGRVIATAGGATDRPLALAIPRPRLWWPWRPYLYGLRVRLVHGASTLDSVRSYFGMRSVALARAGGARRLLLNGRFVFETGALDQGYWPDGLYAAPSDAALRFDIAAAKRLGYDMIREHQKVEPDRWYYWADRLGILVWQDMPSLPRRQPPSAAGEAEFRRELAQVVLQRRSHPSIVVWVPFNEGWGQFDVAAVTRAVRRLAPGSLVDADSGSANCCSALESPASDVRDTHLYSGPFAAAPDRRASVVGEYGGVLAIPPPAHRWPGVPTSIGSPALAWSVGSVTAMLRRQYAELRQEMRLRGLSAAIFTELGCYEQELGIVSYDRRVYTMPPSLVRALNRGLIAASQRPAQLRPQRPGIPPGTTGLWKFDEGGGAVVGDASGHGHPLVLQGGAGWTRGVHGSALSIARPGEAALGPPGLVDTTRSFTVSAWLSPRAARESGSAVSELTAGGSSYSSFSLGISSAPVGMQSLAGLIALHRPPVLATGTWWTFLVPAGPACPASACGVPASLRYDDARSQPALGSWHDVTGVYDEPTATISIYVDGIPEDVEHGFGLPRAAGALMVGAGVGDYAPSDTFIGAIDQVRTYARALSPAEVWQLDRAERLP